MKIILNTPKAIANDAAQPGVPRRVDPGTEIVVPSTGVTRDDADAWLKAGHAALVVPAKAPRKAAAKPKAIKPRATPKAPVVAPVPSKA
jgi:hypothetical protein